MKFFTQNGQLEITSSIQLFRHMKRNELLSLALPWEVWTSPGGGEPASYRAMFPSPYNNGREQLILIAFFAADDGPLTGWDFSPADGMDGPQSQREGKYTKRMRGWFLKRFSIKLPQCDDWGHIDAAYDPYNLTTSIVCNYREAFRTKEEWLEFRKNNFNI